MKRRMQVWPSEVRPGDVVWPGGNLWAERVVARVESTEVTWRGEQVPATRVHFDNGDSWLIQPGGRVSVEREA